METTVKVDAKEILWLQRINYGYGMVSLRKLKDLVKVVERSWSQLIKRCILTAGL